MKMKPTIKLVFAFLLVTLFQAHALAAESLKFAIVDFQAFQQKSKAFQKIGAGYQKKIDEMKKKFDTEQESLKKLEDDFRKQSMMLSLDAQADKKRELERKRRFNKYLYDDLTMEVKSLEMQASDKVGRELEKVINKIAQEEGYHLVFRRGTPGLLFYDDAFEITDKVVETYDKMMKQ
jgi:outer membrane protein